MVVCTPKLTNEVCHDRRWCTFFKPVPFFAYTTQHIGLFWPLLPVLSQIQALFGALFTGLISVALYQNSHKTGMVLDETFVNLGYVAPMLDLIFTVVLVGPQGSTIRSTLCSLWSSCWSFVWLRLFGKEPVETFLADSKKLQTFSSCRNISACKISTWIILRVSSWSAMTSTNIFFKRGEE